MIGLTPPTWVTSDPWPVPRRAPDKPLCDEIAEALRLHREDLIAAGEVAVIERLERLSKHTWHPDRPVEDFRALIDDFAADLSGFSASVLDEAVAEYRRANRWFPHVADLTAICKRLTTERSRRLWRLERVLWAKAEMGRKAETGGYQSYTLEQKIEHHQMMEGYWRERGDLDRVEAERLARETLLAQKS
ncbi:MAG TPA: hypothetical protein VGO34_14840 [Alphaproteobacteria bacterium]|jgi:hypothetical protein